MAAHKRIFITGANGYVGSVITEFAVKDGYEVHGLSRGEAGAKKLAALGATPVRGDLGKVDILKSEASKADIVIHLADAFTGSNFTMPYSEVIAIDAAATKAMTEGLKSTASAGPEKIFVSTSGCLVTQADPNGGETDETAPYETQHALVERYKVEQDQLGQASPGLLRTCIVRLAPMVYGRGGSLLAHFMRSWAAAGAGAAVGDGLNRTTAVHVDDAARLFLLVAERGRSGEVYNATAETDVRMGDLLRATGEAVGVPVATLSLEEALAGMGPFFARFLAGESRASSAKARNEFGWKPREVGILEELTKGSYQAVAKEVRKA